MKPSIIDSPVGDTNDDHAALSADIDGYRRGAVIHALVHFGVPALLRDGEAAADTIAAFAGAHPDAMTRLLDASAAIGLLDRTPRATYRLTSRGALLDDAHPNSVARHARLSVAQYWPAWHRMTDGVRTGRTVFEDAFGCSPWEYRRQNPEQGRLFDAWMQEESRKAVASIVDCLDLTGSRIVADVAGGKGTLLEACLHRWPHLRGILFEQPQTLRSAVSAGQGPFADRLTHVAGDMFDAIPLRADCLLLKSVLHDWDDDRSMQVLSRCAQAMDGGTRLFIVERLLESGLSPAAYLIDLHMMLVTGGRERTLNDYSTLAGTAGLEIVACRRTASDFSLIECRKTSTS